jgi:glutathione reductase (NADPH)
MSDYDYDLFTIGAGSGGVRASRMSAALGARVAVAEERYMGGTCVNVGCIPKKLFAYAGHYAEEFGDAVGFGWSASKPGFDWPILVANKDKEISRLNGIYERLLTGAGVTVFKSRARVLDAHTVEVEGRKVSARHLLVATGGWPVVPDIPGKELAITSNEAFHLPRLPGRVVVVGGGYIALEFASIFHGLGVETVLSYRGDCLLKVFDNDLGTFLGAEMAKKGVRICLRSHILAIERRGGSLVCRFSDGSAIETDAVMYATGRNPNTEGLGLERAGVEVAANGAVIVDDLFQTNVPSVHAIGDVIHKVQLTPVALAEGMLVADRLFGKGQRTLDYRNVATAVFSHPNVGTVGLSEEQARREHADISIYKSTFTALKHRLSGRNELTLMKLVVDKASDRVLGVHMVGAEAGEIIQGFAVALTCGATKAQFDATIGVHPTAAEELVTMREPVSG